MINRRQLCAGLLASPALPLSNAFAGSYPSRPIRLLVPYAAGGGTDAIARLVGNAVGQRLGQTLVVENNGNAGGNIATQMAASAAPDGYTVLMANQGPMAVNPHLFKSLTVDPLSALDPVTLIALVSLVVVVPAASKYKSLKELLDDARAKPGQLTYGSAGHGSASHLAAVLLDVVTGNKTIHIPYRGAGPALNDIVAGQTQYMVTSLPSVMGLIEGKRVRPLAVTTRERSPIMPDVPTVAESGWPEYDAGAWYGFAVPKGTPTRIVEVLRNATLGALTDETVRSRLVQDGAKLVGNTPDEFGEFMKKETARWAGTIKAAGISME